MMKLVPRLTGDNDGGLCSRVKAPPRGRNADEVTFHFLLNSVCYSGFRVFQRNLRQPRSGLPCKRDRPRKGEIVKHTRPHCKTGV
ncbi:MAG: hypothetical protein OXU34_06405 [Gammaproteobacteria bacterium]|nr:hypothetical protein [Gammaproteobacteria bacterium]